jgi:phosphonate ABC transporter permease subunit PhnE
MKLALTAMLETIMIGLMATFLGIILAFPVSFLAARNLMASIVSPLNRLVGSLAGLAIGGWAAAFLTGQAANLIGGLELAPIQIFLIAVVLFLALGFFGMRLGGRLFGSLLSAIGETPGHLAAALLLAIMAAVPGYFLGLGFSRGILSIVIDPELAAMVEVVYGYAGAVIVAAATFAFAWINRKRGNITVGLTIYSVTRTLLNIVRSIEPLIWAIVAGIWVGLGPFAGTIALTLHTIASLAKLYSEAIESIDPGPLEALYATGADRLQTIVYAVIPQILPPFISFTIYRWDINVRMSTIIGLVGGGGIGFILIQWIRLYQYNQVGLAVWLITITVATLDYVSSAIRERFV